MNNKFDVIVIGAGPAGYVAAIRCAQLGMNTACVEMWVDKQGNPALGGTCLNVGCIPSKALLESSHYYEMSQHELAEHGVLPSGVKLDLKKMLQRKDKVVQDLTGGIQQLFKANKITWLQGRGKIRVGKQVEVKAQNGKSELYETANIIIATGSVPIEISAAPYSDDLIVDSTGGLEFRS